MAANPNDLLALRNQQPTELSNQADDIGGPRPTWSTADYANFSFDAARGLRQDTSAASSVKAPVGPQKSELGEDEDTEEKKDDLTEDDDLDADLDSLDVSDADGDGIDDVDSDPEFLSDEDDDDLNTIDLDINEEEDDDDNPFVKEEEESDDEKKEVSESDDEDEDDKGLNESDDEDEDDKLEESEDSDEDDKLEEEDDEDEDKKGKNPFAESEDSDEDDKGLNESDDEDEDDKLEEEDDDEDEKELAESKTPIRIRINFSESKKLFESNTNLSEEDKRSSKALFESAVRNVAKSVARQLQEAYKQRYIKSVKLQEKATAKKIDKYLSYVVEQWVADNKVPLRAQLRSKLTENFLAGLKGLLEQNYVEVPKGKVDVVKALAENVKTLKTKLKLAEQTNAKLHAKTKKVVVTERKALVKEHKRALIADAARVLPLSEQGKFTERAQTLRFTGTKNFRKDLVTLREQYKAAEGAGKERLLAVPNALPIFEENQSSPKSDVERYAALTSKLIS